MKEKKVIPEREKGTPPPDYIPAIFGWITFEDQQEQAREIVDFTDKLNQNNEDEG